MKLDLRDYLALTRDAALLFGGLAIGVGAIVSPFIVLIVK